MLRLVAAGFALVVVAAAVALWWWTAPPAAPVMELAAALAPGAARGDGAVAIAQPSRAGRWLFRHPGAAALIVAAAPDTLAAGRRLGPFARALAEAASGPLVAWWRGGEVAVAAVVDAGARRGLVELAAMRGLAAADLEGSFAVATAPELLQTFTERSLPPPRFAEPTATAAAVIWTGGHSWQAVATADGLTATSGEPAELAPVDAWSVAVTESAGRLLGTAGLGDLGLGDRFALLLDGSGGWALRLAEAALSRDARRLLGGGDPGAGATHHSRGPFGEIWWRADGGVAVATSEALLTRVVGLAPGEYGACRGDTLAEALRRLAETVDAVPGFAARSATLAGAADSVAAIDTVRWRITTGGGAVRMEW